MGGPESILAVPCCQHELNRQIHNEVLAPVFSYGVLKERIAALMTDGLRAQMLEQAGYDTQILEFIDMEHTPKNLLIRAVYTGKKKEQIVESIKAEMIDSADLLNFVTKFDDFEKGTKAGKINVVTGIEGLSQIGEDIDMIDYFYNEVGARHAMLTWNELNALATGCPQDPTRGLTEAGKRAVKRMEKSGHGAGRFPPQ